MHCSGSYALPQYDQRNDDDLRNGRRSSAAPLSRACEALETGGFASPSQDGFALRVRSRDSFAAERKLSVVADMTNIKLLDSP